MPKATVIFADGSKQLAHNLNDLNLRWYERKIAQAEDVAALYEQGVAIPELVTPETIDEALNLRTQFIAMKNALLEQYRTINEQRYGKQEDRYRRRPIGYAVQLVDLRLSEIAAFIKQYNITTSMDRDDYVQRLKDENDALKERIKDLEATISAYREVVTLQLAEQSAP